MSNEIVDKANKLIQDADSMQEELLRIVKLLNDIKADLYLIILEKEST